MSDSLHGLACAQIVELERDLAAARERIAEINDYALTCKDRIAALEAERDRLTAIVREVICERKQINPTYAKLDTTEAVLKAWVTLNARRSEP
jgi:chromosome segregation ATPase